MTELTAGSLARFGFSNPQRSQAILAGDLSPLVAAWGLEPWKAVADPDQSVLELARIAEASPALLAELAEEASSLGADATFAPNGPVILALRRVPIRRALRNLIENAQRHGGGARVSLEQTDGTVRIIIDDDGPGIDPADLDRVFDPFERLETSRSRDTGGTGLGLPITRAILRAHGGEIRLENRPRGGLRVIARLPKNGV